MNNANLQQLLGRFDSKKGRQIILIATLLLVAYIGWTSIKPGYQSAKDDRAQAAQVRADAAKQRQDYNILLPQLKSSRASDISSALDIAMPDHVDNVTLDKLLNNLAMQTGVQIGGFTPGQTPSPGKAYQTLQVGLNVNGTYVNCLRFLNGLQQMVQIKGDGAPKAYGPIWSITSVSLNGADSANTNMVIAANMYLNGSGGSQASSGSGGSSGSTAKSGSGGGTP